MSLLRTSTQHVSCELAGETVIMDLQSGKYYGLDPVASVIWTYLEQPRPLDDVVNHLLGKYDVSVEHCKSELAAHLGEMQQLGLIEPAD